MAQAFKDDTERYRKAMELTLQQLDWCIGYLHGIGRTAVSQALARNRMYIAQHVARETEIKLPTENAAAAKE